MGANTSKIGSDLSYPSNDNEAVSTQTNTPQQLGLGLSPNMTSRQAPSTSSGRDSRPTTTNSSSRIPSRTNSASVGVASLQSPLDSPHGGPSSTRPMATVHPVGCKTSPGLEWTADLGRLKRPLPPVQSRETVRSQAAGVTHWTKLDDTGDIFESTQIGTSNPATSSIAFPAVPQYVTNLSNFDTKIPVVLSDTGSSTLSSPTSVYLSDTDTDSSVPSPSTPVSSIGIPSAHGYHSVFSSSGRKNTRAAVPITQKRPLRPTATAIQLACRKFETSSLLEDGDEETFEVFEAAKQSNFGFHNPFPDGFPLTSEEEEWLLPDPHPGSCLYQDSDHEDKSHWSQLVELAVPTQDETAEQHVRRQAQFIMRLFDKKLVASAPRQHVNREEDVLLAQARECMLKEQEEGAVRSRRLREQALQRNLSLDSPGTSVTLQHTIIPEPGDTHPVGAQFNATDGDVYMQDVTEHTRNFATENSDGMQRDESRTNRSNEAALDSGPPFATGAIAESLKIPEHDSMVIEIDQDTQQVPTLKSTPTPTSTSLVAERSSQAIQHSRVGTPAIQSRVRSSLFDKQSARGDFGSRTAHHEPQNPAFAHRGRPRTHHREQLRDERSLIDRILDTGFVEEKHDEDKKENQQLYPQPASGLQMLAAKRGVPQPTAPLNTAVDVKRPAFAPASSGESARLTLPKTFDQMSEEIKRVIVEHETAKERRRDLDAIGSYFYEFSQLICFRNRELTDRIMQTESEERREVNRFIKLVIDEKKSGKLRRKRIQDINDNIKRRIVKAEDSGKRPSDSAIFEEMQRSLPTQYIDLLDCEIPKLQEEIDRWGDLRRSSKNQRKEYGRRRDRQSEPGAEVSSPRRVRFQDEEDDLQRPKRTARKPPVRHGTVSENRRETHAERQERLTAHYKAQLKLFDSAAPQDIKDLQRQIVDTEAELETITRQDDNDSDSEEETGAQFYFGAGPNKSEAHQPDQDLNEINRLEDARQRDAGMHATQRHADHSNLTVQGVKERQAFDPELLRQMQQRKAREIEAATDSSIIRDKHAVTDSGDDDVASEAEEIRALDDAIRSPADDELLHAYVYVIWGAFRGVLGYDDNDEYRIMTTYDYKKAKGEVKNIITELKSLPHDTISNPGRKTVHKTNNPEEGYYEKHLMLGGDVEVEARVWTERFLIDSTQRRFQKAKQQGAVKTLVIYIVQWEKTVTPVIDEAGETLDPELQGYEDLFEDSPAERALARQPVTTTGKEDTPFSDSILANRHAKNLYFKWFSKFWPGLAGEGQLKIEDDALEQRLEALGTFGLFCEEEHFELSAEKVEECYKVWVKQVPVKGPGN